MTEEKTARRVPQQARGRERYNLILDSAAGLFAEVGYETATTNAIASEAGIAIGSLYHYFSSKEEILHALSDRYLADLMQLQAEVFGADISDASIEELVDRQIDPFIRFFMEHPGFEHIMLGAEVSADLAAATAELDDAVTTGLKASLQQRNPQLSDDQALLAATVAKGMVKGLFGLLRANADPAFQADIMTEYKRSLVGYVRGVVDKTA